MAENSIVLGMADLMVVSAPIKLITLGLGSCIGLVVYDTFAKVAGMAHIMLPDSRGLKTAEKVGKFADTAVPAIIEEMLKKGATRARIKAKIAGGAQMFSLPGGKCGVSYGRRKERQRDSQTPSQHGYSSCSF